MKNPNSKTNHLPSKNLPRHIPLVIHLQHEDKERLRLLAAGEHRTMSNLAGKILIDAMSEMEQGIDPAIS